MSRTVPGDHVVPEATLTTEVIRDQSGLDALADEWTALYSRIPALTPFQSHGWAAAWARAYCRPGRLRVITVRDAGRLVAVAPFHVSRRTPVPVLATLGGEISDYHDLLVPADGIREWRAITRALMAEPGWRVLDVPEVRPDAAARPWIAAWTGRVTWQKGDTSLELPAQPLETLLAHVPSVTARKIRRSLHKADATGICKSAAPPEKAVDAVSATLALHEEQWQNRGINPEHQTGRFRAHLTEAIPRMVAAGQAAVTQFHLDGELVLSQVGLIGHHFVGGYLAGISPLLRKRIHVAMLQVRSDLELAVAAGVPRYSLMRGTEDYKGHFRPETVVCHRVLLSRPGRLGGVGYPMAAQVRAAVYDWGREHVPSLRAARQWWIRFRTPAASRAAG